MLRLSSVLGGVAFVIAATAATPSPALTPIPRMSPVAQAMQAYVDDGELAGAVVLVARDGEILEFAAVGTGDLNTKEPLMTDGLFWVASMTKSITAAAVLILAEEGKLSLDDPVEKYLPAFKHPWMVSEKTAARQVLTRPAHPPTIRQLLDHTHGLAEIPTPAAYTPLEEWVDEIARGPLQFEPGSEWRYGNCGNNVAGRIIEVVSGMPYVEFLRQRIFEPLGMKDTTFYPDAGQLARLSKSYRRGGPHGGGPLEETGIGFFKGDYASDRRTVQPGAGLFSTAADQWHFYQMLADGGGLGGKRILSEASVKEMTRNQTGEYKAGFSPGMGWGLGMGVVREPQGWTEGLPVGTYGHDGAYGPTGCVVREQKLVMMMMIQRADLNPFADGLKFRHAFQSAVLKAYGVEVK